MEVVRPRAFCHSSKLSFMSHQRFCINRGTCPIVLKRSPEILVYVYSFGHSYRFRTCVLFTYVRKFYALYKHFHGIVCGPSSLVFTLGNPFQFL